MSRLIDSADHDNKRLVSYEYYRDSYYGDKVSNVNQFHKLNKRAELAVVFYTLNKVSAFEKGSLEYELLLDTICEIVDHYYEIDRIGFKNNEKQGDISVSYDSIDSKEIVMRIIRRNLSHTGALYRGV